MQDNMPHITEPTVLEDGKSLEPLEEHAPSHALEERIGEVGQDRLHDPNLFRVQGLGFREVLGVWGLWGLWEGFCTK